MEDMAVEYVSSLAVSTSVIFTRYSLMTPFLSSVDGGVQLSSRVVELKTVTPKSPGEVLGAAIKCGIKCQNITIQHL